LLADLPKVGTLNRRQIATLAGLARFSYVGRVEVEEGVFRITAQMLELDPSTL